MKEFFIDFYIEPFRDDVWEAIMGIVVWIVTLAIIFGIVYGVLFLIDYTNRPLNYGSGIVVEKKFIPEHTSTTWIYNPSTKTSMPSVIHYVDEWKIFVKVDGMTGSYSVSKIQYDRLTENQSVKIEYTYGRIWKTVYIKWVLVN